MTDFSTILQDPSIRAITQENILERAFHDALYPRNMYRGEATPQVFPLNVGDSMIFTGTGLIAPKMLPLRPGTDPTPSDYQKEQWSCQLQQYADSIDTHMPSSIASIANLFLRNAQQLGLSAGMSLNRLVRDRLFNAAESGTSNVVGAVNGATSTISVAHLNGLTRSRNPSSLTGSTVQFSQVSSSNPLAVFIQPDPTASALSSFSVIGYTPAIAGDEIGPGTLTLAAPVTFANITGSTKRPQIFAYDHTSVHFVGGAVTTGGTVSGIGIANGTSVEDIASNDVLRLADIRVAVSRLRQENAPAHADGRYHAHMDPTSESEIFGDPEWQRLQTALPDYFQYKDYCIGEQLGCLFFRNTESPQAETVTTGVNGAYSQQDPLGVDLTSNGLSTGTPIHRVLFTAQGAIYEYYQDLSALITEAGITGRVGEPRITNNGIEVYTDRVQFIIRSPLNRLQDLVSSSWKFIGDWAVRTDAATGDSARYKRLFTVAHG